MKVKILIKGLGFNPIILANTYFIVCMINKWTILINLDIKDNIMYLNLEKKEFVKILWMIINKTIRLKIKNQFILCKMKRKYIINYFFNRMFKFTSKLNKIYIFLE